MSSWCFGVRAAFIANIADTHAADICRGSKSFFRDKNAQPHNAGIDDNMITHNMCTEGNPRNVLFLHASDFEQDIRKRHLFSFDANSSNIP